MYGAAETLVAILEELTSLVAKMYLEVFGKPVSLLKRIEFLLGETTLKGQDRPHSSQVRGTLWL